MTSDAPVVDGRRDALNRAVLPSEQSHLELQYLFDHGYTAFHTDDGDVDADGLSSAIERFVLEAFDPSDPRERTEPFVEDPAVLATVASLATVCTTDHPALADTPTDRLQLVADLRALYAATVQDLVASASDDLLQELAEVIYAKDAGEQGPHLGRVCTGVVHDPSFLDAGGMFVEIPMPAASPECIVRVTEDGVGGEYDARESGVDGDLATRVWNNNVYVPVEDCRRKHWERLKRGFGALIDAQNATLDDDQREWIRTRADGVGARIERFLEAGREGRVWKGWNGADQLVRLVSAALSASDLDTDGVYPAEVVFEALERYDPSSGWETSLYHRISSPSTLEARLVDVESDRLNILETDDGRLFGLQSRSGNELVVEEIEDLFELPCLGNMDDRLQERGPVRKDLFNFVRMVLWLPQYQGASEEDVVRDLQGVFDRWPWHDPTETEYQIQYEFGNTIGGETPLPMNCDNDDMQRYCIGKEECPYSIWGSVPFSDSLYEAVDDESDSARF